MAPKVSVVVTCFNLGRYLDEAILSVEAQTLRDLELVVVDDGSEDPQTLAVLDRYRPPRATVLRTANSGLPAARNYGVRHTRGEYICCLDGDDRLLPTWLEKAAGKLDAEPELAFVSHWLRTFGDRHEEWTPERCDFPALLDHNTINGAALVRRQVWEEVGGQEESLRRGYEDWDFWITLVERGQRGAILPEVLFEYRQRPDSMSRAFDDATHLELYAQLVERHRATFATHLPALWRRRQHDLAQALAEGERLELEWRSWLAAKLADRRLQARALGDLLAAEARSADDDAVAQLEAALADARREVAALRRSWSWRVTSPLRRVAGALRGEKIPRP